MECPRSEWNLPRRLRPLSGGGNFGKREAIKARNNGILRERSAQCHQGWDEWADYRPSRRDLNPLGIRNPALKRRAILEGPSGTAKPYLVTFRFSCNNSSPSFVIWVGGMIRELEFKILCEQHSDEIYRYARTLLANQADAEDATQEILLRLWHRLPRLNPFNLRAWLLQTTRWYCLDQIRRRSNQAAPLPLEEGALENQPDELAVNPSLAADSRLRLEQARRALLKLPENLRSVFVLYEVNGLRYREIATTLGIPINSVKVYLSRARERLSNLTTQETPCKKTCHD